MAVKNLNKNIDWYKSEFSRFENKLNGQSQSALHRIRQDAINQFIESGFPTTRNEEWKYTNIEPITETAFHPIHEYKEGMVTESDVKKWSYNCMDCYKIVFVNGHFAAELSDTNDLDDQIFVTNLKDAINSNDARVDQFLTKIASFNNDTFTALSTAFIQDGAVIQIKENAVVQKPILLIFVAAGKENNILSHPRNLIIAENNSQATIIESYSNKDVDNYFSNVVTEILLKPNSSVEHIKIQNESTKAYHVSTLHAHQDNDSRFRSFAINLGGRIVRNNIITILNGSGAESTLNGIYVGNNDQHIDNRTVIEHVKPNCTSSEIYKGIMNDKSRGVFNGKIHVHPGAQKTNAVQSNSGLLLSDSASIDTKPQLEIYADDVRCTHGATIGQLDKDALFYLRSRAIGLQKAKNMLINAFVSEVMDQINNDNLKTEVQNLINAKLRLISK